MRLFLPPQSVLSLETLSQSCCLEKLQCCDETYGALDQLPKMLKVVSQTSGILEVSVSDWFGKQQFQEHACKIGVSKIVRKLRGY